MSSPPIKQYIIIVCVCQGLRYLFPLMLPWQSNCCGQASKPAGRQQRMNRASVSNERHYYPMSPCKLIPQIQLMEIEMKGNWCCDSVGQLCLIHAASKRKTLGRSRVYESARIPPRRSCIRPNVQENTEDVLAGKTFWRDLFGRHVH